MQLLARLMDHVLRATGRRATIVGATSGDTGSAAIEAFRGLDQVDIVILYPHGRVSDVQRRQMTTVAAPQRPCRRARRHVRRLPGRREGDVQPPCLPRRTRPVWRQFHQLGPHRRADRLLLHRRGGARRAAPRQFLRRADRQFRRHLRRLCRQAHGAAGRAAADRHQCQRHPRRARSPPAPTRRAALSRHSAPSMDIQVSSNFERLLFEARGRDAAGAARPDGEPRRSPGGSTSPRRRSPRSAPISMRRVPTRPRSPKRSAPIERQAGYLLDPHTAVGVAAAAKGRRDLAVPMVVLGTAHPAKFPAAVEAASGVRPVLPPHLADLLDRPERFTALPNDQRRHRGLRPRALARGGGSGRMSVEVTTLAIRPDHRHRRHAASRDGLARRLGRRRRALGGGGRARPVASPRAYGLQGHAAARCPAHRRGDRKRRAAS